MRLAGTWDRGRWVAVGIAFLIAVLAAAAVAQAIQLADQREAQQQRREAMQAATRQVVLLTTVDTTTDPDDLDRLTGGATEGFRDQFAQDAAAFFKTLKDAKVVSKGSVDSVGLTKFSDTKAEALVAATGTVTNASTEKPDRRTYRLQVKLERVDEQWLVAGMRFVV